jgi:hypothetical protein
VKKLLTLVSFILPFAFILSCNGSNDSSASASGQNLSSDQINQVSKALIGALNASSSGSASPASVNTDEISADETVDVDGITYANTCNGSADKFTGTANGSYNCASSGHITYSGNFSTSCTQWTYYTPNPGSPYCICNADWYTSNSMTFQLSDRTNNLNDCDTGNGVILDGTVYVMATGKGTTINITMNGTIGINKRGPTGGLELLASECLIFLQYLSSTGKVTGSICGHSVS